MTAVVSSKVCLAEVENNELARLLRLAPSREWSLTAVVVRPRRAAVGWTLVQRSDTWPVGLRPVRAAATAAGWRVGNGAQCRSLLMFGWRR